MFIDMIGFGESGKDVLRSAGHDYIFRSALQFEVWYLTLTKYLKDIDALDEGDGKM